MKVEVEGNEDKSFSAVYVQKNQIDPQAKSVFKINLTEPLTVKYKVSDDKPCPKFTLLIYPRVDLRTITVTSNTRKHS